ncbi:hypothetical protein FACS1894162_4420 [Bacteroidia bacterium]|nr:hypothetical protein FACS1894162_4420 [Bacteroidia bacterium]
MRKNLFLSWLLCIAFSFNAAAQISFSGGGLGSESDPYVILTPEDLVKIHDVTYNPTAYTYFRMDADVDLAGIEWAAFNTTGTFDKPVYFDGNGHVIKNLDAGGYNYAGLFGILRGVCKNLGVINARVGDASSYYTGSNPCATAGIIAGYLANNNYNTAIGQGIIENCYTTGVVSATQIAGGIAGNMGRPASGSGHPLSRIRNCYSKATVTTSATTGNSRAGGIVGVVPAPAGVSPVPVEIEYCFSTGTVTAGSTNSQYNGPGGVVGYSDTPLNGLVSLNAGIIRSDASYDQYGRIAAVVTNSSAATECWALNTVTITKNAVQKASFNETTPVTNNNSYDGVSKTAEFLADFDNWKNFGYDDSVWKMGHNGYPIFIWQDFASDNNFPEGTAGNPFKIYTATDLNKVRDNMNAYYVLMNNIDVSGDYPSWIPLGKTAQGNGDFTAFNGNFDGNGYLISGVNINYTGSYVGFFAVVGGTVKNLGIKGIVTNTAGTATGLLTGYLGQASQSSTIENCYAEGTVTLTASNANAHAGILVGNQTQAHSIIRYCHVKGSVSNDKDFTGGIAGRQNTSGGTISNCYSEADVTGANYVGGIVGRIYGANVNNCYATGTINGVSYVGGIAGERYNSAASSGLVAANVAVRATTGNFGRALGSIGAGATVSNVYGLESTVVELNGVSQTITSSATGKDGAHIPGGGAAAKTQAFYEGLGWDFNAIWGIDEGLGYPYFLSSVLQMDADTTAAASSYVAGNIVFLSDNDETAQLLGATNLQVSGRVKVVKTFDTGKWYPVGFPFALAGISIKQGGTTRQGVIYSGDQDDIAFTDNGGADDNFFVKYYHGESNRFKFTDEIEAGKAYIIEFPEGDQFTSGTVEVTFTSEANPVLNSASTTHTAYDADKYTLVINPNVANIDGWADATHYYRYDYSDHFEETATISDLKPFEAVVVYNGESGQALRVIGDGLGQTGITEPVLSFDPVVATQYYNLQGVQISVGALRATPLQPGVYIMKTVYQSGKSEVSKIIVKQ